MDAKIFFYPMFPAMQNSPFPNFFIFKNLVLTSGTFDSNHLPEKPLPFFNPTAFFAALVSKIEWFL